MVSGGGAVGPWGSAWEEDSRFIDACIIVCHARPSDLHVLHRSRTRWLRKHRAIH